MVERRGFEPLTSAVQAPTPLTAPPLASTQVFGRNAQRAVIRRRVRERVRSTLCCPPSSAQRTGWKARESGLRLKAWRRTRGGYSATAARLPLEAWHEARGRSRADHHRARPLPITLDELARGGGGWARGAGSAARTRTGGARRIFARPHRLVRERQRNMSRMDSQSNEFFSWCSPTAGSSDSSSARSASGAP
jgi:hypothetical protein